jgi:L-ribulokinase
MPYTLGIDYGSNSVRAIVVNVTNVCEPGSCVMDYPSGRHGILLDPRNHNVARQHRNHSLFGLKASICGALKKEAAKDPVL